MTVHDWVTLGAIIVLIAISGFFAASETAVTGASRARLHQLETEGDARAGVLNRLRARKGRMLGALLFGNNLANILASSLATSVLIGLLGDAGVAYATVAMTLLILIFAEVLPKTYALHKTDAAALAMARLVQLSVVVLRPPALAIDWIVRGALRLFGIDLTDLPDGDEEELRGAIELHRGTDEEIRHERAMLRSILDLADVAVSEIMVHRRHLVAVDIDLPVEQIIDAVLESHFTRLPLWQGEPDNIVGVLHAKALLREMRAHGDDLAALDVLAIAAKPWFIPDTTSLLDQLQAFRKRREHFALVVDEYGSLMGVVTLEDILEEIVGDISDEHDVIVAGVRPQPNGSYIVNGTVTLRDLNRQFEWRLPDEKASTIAGLVLHEARRIPDIGQTFTFYGFRFEILRRQRHQITLLRLTPPDAGNR